ncbi:MAG: hypothetical protein ABS911_12555 [Carnobacterium sp.]|uniref:hypothetical protein n=1 Tax=Carnobacterium sp. TaxID=48221 RepID=UPI003314E6C0
MNDMENINIRDIEMLREVAEELLQNRESPSKIIRDLAWIILSQNESVPVSLKSIRNLISETTGRIFSPGIYSGAMRDLTDESNGRIVNVDRGYYLYETNIKRGQIIRTINQCKKDLDNLAVDNILRLSNEDIQSIQMIPHIIQELDNIIKKIEQ